MAAELYNLGIISRDTRGWHINGIRSWGVATAHAVDGTPEIIGPGVNIAYGEQPARGYVAVVEVSDDTNNSVDRTIVTGPGGQAFLDARTSLAEVVQEVESIDVQGIIDASIQDTSLQSVFPQAQLPRKFDETFARDLWNQNIANSVANSTVAIQLEPDFLSFRNKIAWKYVLDDPTVQGEFEALIIEYSAFFTAGVPPTFTSAMLLLREQWELDRESIDYGKNFEYWVNTFANTVEVGLLAVDTATIPIDKLGILKFATAVVASYSFGFVLGDPAVLNI